VQPQRIERKRKEERIAAATPQANQHQWGDDDPAFDGDKSAEVIEKRFAAGTDERVQPSGKERGWAGIGRVVEDVVVLGEPDRLRATERERCADLAEVTGEIRQHD